MSRSSEMLQTEESRMATPNSDSSHPLDTDAQTGTEGISGCGASTSKTKRKKSKVWDFFKTVRVPIAGCPGRFEEKAQCIYCGTQLGCDSKINGTNGLNYHANTCKENPVNSQKTILTYVSEGGDGGAAGGNLKNWHFDQEAVRKALAYMVSVDELPFRFVERAGFQHFMRVACPLFSIPSRWTVARDCYALYENEKLKLKSFLKKSAQRVCLTTDTWTSIQRVNYLCLTVHFIDNNWNLNKRILSFVPIISHKGEDIGMVVESCLIDWDLANVLTITVDNAGSNNTAIAYLKKRLSVRNGCLLAGKYLYMRCIAHIINLIVVDGLKSMNRSISCIRNAVRYVRQSPSRWAKFKECIVAENIESKSHVCLDVRTRWNSTYLMLESAVKFETAFERLEVVDSFFVIELSSKNKGKSITDVTDDGQNVMNCDDETMCIPNKEDWENARRFVGFLRHFFTLTVRISGSKYVTSNTFFTEISGILCLLEQWKKDKDYEMVSMAVRMRLKFDKYWGDSKKMNLLIYIAVVLDPRYKLDYLQWAFEEIYISGTSDVHREANELGELVKSALLEMFNEYLTINKCKSGGVKEGGGTSSVQSDVNEISTIGEGTSQILSRYMMHKSRAQNEENRTELDIYLKEDTENMNAEFDILGWWKMHCPRFPILSQMAHDILAIPISTVASESAFSTSGRILDAFRSSLTPRLVEALICTQDWIRNRTSQSHVGVEEDVAELEKFDEELMKFNAEAMNVE